MPSIQDKLKRGLKRRLTRTRPALTDGVRATLSITRGILWGFISHVPLHLLAGRRGEIRPVMCALAPISLLAWT